MTLKKRTWVCLVVFALAGLEGCGLNNAPVGSTAGSAAGSSSGSSAGGSAGSSAAAAQSTGSLVVQSTLGVGTVGQFYSGTAQVKGGTPAYTWSISSGSLPAGLTLRADTGVFSGTPTATGTASFTLTVTDSSTAKEQFSQPMSISIAAAVAPLTIATEVLPNGTAGSLYSAMLQAAGGTPGYLWSMPAGGLPPGMTLDRSTGVLSGTPAAAGTYAFTLSVQDGSSPAQVETASLSLTVNNAASQSTWYVRRDGGTRYSLNVPTGQCDGLGDAAYPGSGVNRHCAFNDIRLLWQDGSFAYAPQYGVNFPGNGWVGKGGDTYLIRGSVGAGSPPWRIGRSLGSVNGEDPALAAAGSPAPYRGFPGDPYVGAPPPPAGTAAQHTRILGENWQSCHQQSARTPVIGGNSGVVWTLNTPFVDFQCMDISDQSDCVVGCVGKDFASIGIQIANTATHLLLQDVRVHGMETFGLWGPSGDGTVMNYLSLVGNGGGGWNADSGDGTTGTGSLLVSNYEILWNGCGEEYPVVDKLPYKSCRDQNSGGYGDGFGTATVTSNPGWQAHFDQGTVAYNTQDGLDALHLVGNGSSMTVTRTLAYGNMGQQVKVGGAAGTLENSVIVGNCDAMSNAIPGTPAGFNALLSGFCRAGNQALLMTAGHGTTTSIRHNTLMGNGALLLGYVCDGSAGNCDGTALIDLRDNIFLGNPDPIRGNPGANYLMVIDGTYPTQAACDAVAHHSWTTDGAVGCGNDVFFNVGSYNRNNVYWGVKDGCTDHNGQGNLCVDPGLNSETQPLYGFPDLTLAPRGGAAFQAGANLSSLPTDYAAKPFHTPPSIGALEIGTALTPYVGEQ